MTTWLDYTFLASLALLFPILGYGSYQRMQKQLAAGVADVRIHSYRKTMILEWSLLGAVLLLWLQENRAPDALGFVPAAGWRFALGLAVALVIAALFAWQAWNYPRAAPADREKLRGQLESLRDFLPHTRRELRSFWFLSVAAGICEEVVYRGYLIWLLGSFAGTWFAVLGSSAIFALGHSYQGFENMSRIFLVGLAMAALYLGTGSLWAPILLHAAGDIFQGLLAYRFVTDTAAPAAAIESPPEAMA